MDTDRLLRAAASAASKLCREKLQHGVAAVVVADADGFEDFGDEDLAVADLSGARGIDQGADDLVLAVGRDHHVELHLGQQVDVVLASAVDLLVALLAAVAAHLGNRNAVDADGLQSVLHAVELEGLDDLFDSVHGTMIRDCTLLLRATRGPSPWTPP